MKKLILFVSLLFITSNSYSQTGWYRVTDSIPNFRILTIQMVSPYTGYAVGCYNNYLKGIFFKTTNSGLNWHADTIYNYQPVDLFFLNYNTGYIANWNIPYSKVFKTTNAGINWIVCDTMYASIFKIKFYNANTGIVAYKNDYARKTTDGGNTWTGLTGMFWHEPSSICCLDANTWLVASNYAYFNKTTNGGLNWTIQNFTGVGFVPKSLYFINNTTGIGLDWNGKIIKTTDKGDSWIQIDSLNTYYATGEIFFVNDNTGYVCGIGYYNGIYKTTNGGYHWVQQITNPSSFGGNTISFINSTTGFVGGDNGFIYKTTTGGSVFVKNISSEIPDKFSLSQNYPNPFNPLTIIKYMIAENRKSKMENGTVTLKIYNIQGREVAKLVNEKQTPGTYEVSWDASQFPSGTYFYKLQAGDFVEVKKMVLLK